MPVLGAILIIIACLAASAFFSGSETALFRLRSHDLDGDDKEAVGPADAAVRDLTSSSSRLLVTILLGNNVVNILGASVASGLAIHFLGVEAGIPVATIVMTILVLVFCEILPKAVAARHPRGVSRMVGLPLYLFHQMLRPIHGLFDRVIEPLVRRVTGGVDSNSSLGSEEVLRLAREALQDVDDAGSLHTEAHWCRTVAATTALMKHQFTVFFAQLINNLFGFVGHGDSFSQYLHQSLGD